MPYHLPEKPSVMVNNCSECPLFNANAFKCQFPANFTPVVTKPNAQDATPGLPENCPLRQRGLLIVINQALLNPPPPV